MANAVRKRWVQNSWSGGISEDKMIGQPDSYQMSVNMNIDAISYGVTPQYSHLINSSGDVVETTQILSPTVDVGAVIHFFAIDNFIFAFTSEGDIFRKDAADLTDDWTGIYSITNPTGGAGSTGYCVYNDYFYYDYPSGATEIKLHRIAVSQMKGSVTSIEVIGTFQSVQSDNIKSRPMLEMWNKLYIGDGSNLVEVDDTAGTHTFTEDKLLVPQEEGIVAITFDSNTAKIYTNKVQSSGTLSYSNRDSRCYTWDGTSGAYNSSLVFGGLCIMDAVSSYGQDFVLAMETGSTHHNYPSLYISNGYQYQMVVKSLPQRDLSPKSSYFGTSAGKYLLPCQDGVYILCENDVLKFSKPFSNKPYSLKHFTFLIDDAISEGGSFSAIGLAFGSLFLASYSDSGGGIGHTRTYYIGAQEDKATYLATWSHIRSRIFSDNDIIRTKRLVNIKIHFQLIRTIDVIYFWVRKNPLHGIYGADLFTNLSKGQSERIRMETSLQGYVLNPFGGLDDAEDDGFKLVAIIGYQHGTTRSPQTISAASLFGENNEFNTLEYAFDIYTDPTITQEPVTVPSQWFAPVVYGVEIEYDAIYE